MTAWQRLGERGRNDLCDARERTTTATPIWNMIATLTEEIEVAFDVPTYDPPEI